MQKPLVTRAHFRIGTEPAHDRGGVETNHRTARDPDARPHRNVAWPHHGPAEFDRSRLPRIAYEGETAGDGRDRLRELREIVTHRRALIGRGALGLRRNTVEQPGRLSTNSRLATAMLMSFFAGPSTAPPVTANCGTRPGTASSIQVTALVSIVFAWRGKLTVEMPSRLTRGACWNNEAAALKGARLARNSPTALVANAAAELVECGEVAARLRIAGVVLSVGHRARAMLSAVSYRVGSIACLAVTSAARATNGNGV